ncbi:hypothetical protein ESA94_02950 [Lacibacter luteus]|uniref:Uncharacterized protein n=1 Tax=Lacibacter luteus TaxID=2508719 RepID=A0A4Q1CMZ7_9BACT|nr:hypothetical protein [Lacibacter luteus]RXK61989.1 hypothetical protein ESA94_02950 [Lacibacter luteus]
MGLFRNLFKTLFGTSNNTKKETPAPPVIDYMAAWEKERQERITAAEHKLKDWISAQVKEKENLSFTWESGNDEAFVTFKDASTEEEDNFFELEQYMIDKLDIPDAGEFEMNGKGNISIENNRVVVKYSSTIKALLDFNEETEEEIYSEEEQDSGEKTLFEL